MSYEVREALRGSPLESETFSATRTEKPSTVF